MVPLDEFTPPGGDRIPDDLRRNTKGQSIVNHPDTGVVLRCACGVRPLMDHPQLFDLSGVPTTARLPTGGRVGAMEPSVA